MKFYLLIFTLIANNIIVAQTNNDTAFNKSLDSVVVQAMYSNVQWKEVPAAIAILKQNNLTQLSNHSFLPALNAISGVRLEERSPGSYRLSIRGSLLRSPFGVRNIKVYWNNLPLSDATGNTYFNLLELQQIQSVELVKGPVASIYGSGSGGLVLLQSTIPYSNQKKYSLNASITSGSYGLLANRVQLKIQHKNVAMQFLQAHTQSNGYRQQSALNKNTLAYNLSVKYAKNTIEFSSFYTSLVYQTPGGITYEQMLQNPTLARQATATLPSALQQQAAVYNNTFLAGISHSYIVNNLLQINTVFSYNSTQFQNPFITNYEKRNEHNASIASKFILKKQLKDWQIKWVSGFEYLVNKSAIENYGNRNGFIDTLQFNDLVKANQWFVFSQLQLQYKKLNLQMGVSINEQWYAFNRLSDVNFGKAQSYTSKIIATPRVAMSIKLNEHTSLYALVAKGFSAPTLAEIKPSDGSFYNNLKAEFGWNFELGIKGSCLNYKLQFDIAVYTIKLNNAIVRRNNVSGTEYFVNAGGAEQKGIETTIQYQLLQKNTGFVRSIQFNNSNSFQPYKFINYTVGNTNFSGNSITGVPKQIHVFSVAISMTNNIALNVQYNYTSTIPLTDANDAFANDYKLLQLKISVPFNTKKMATQLFIGADNILNEQYSLGNDINAAGRRFYNPAPTRNYFAGCSIQLD